MPHPERLERRTRGWARLGRRVRGRALEWALAQEAPNRERMSRIFDDFDIVLTPVTTVPAWELGRWSGRGPIWTFNGMGQVVPYPGIWNQTGLPAAAVPAGFTRDGLPLGVQIVGPANSEGKLLSLAAQVQVERDWTERRPAI